MAFVDTMRLYRYPRRHEKSDRAIMGLLAEDLIDAIIDDMLPVGDGKTLVWEHPHWLTISLSKAPDGEKFRAVIDCGPDCIIKGTVDFKKQDQTGFYARLLGSLIEGHNELR